VEVFEKYIISRRGKTRRKEETGKCGRLENVGEPLNELK